MKNGTVLLVIGGEQKTFTTDFVFARLGREGVTKNVNSATQKRPIRHLGESNDGDRIGCCFLI